MSDVQRIDRELLAQLVLALRCAKPWLEFAQEYVHEDCADELDRVVDDVRAALAAIDKEPA